MLAPSTVVRRFHLALSEFLLWAFRKRNTVIQLHFEVSSVPGGTGKVDLATKRTNDPDALGLLSSLETHPGQVVGIMTLSSTHFFCKFSELEKKIKHPGLLTSQPR